MGTDKLFAMQSYDGVSICDIAHDNAVPSRLVSHYFAKKDGLFETTLAHQKSSIEALLTLLKKAKDQINVPDALEKLVYAGCAL